MRVRAIAVALIAALTPVFAMAAPASASTVTKTLTFDEIAATPVNGLHMFGVKFGFKVGGVASTDATYGGGGPGTTKYVSDPSLEGNASGTLTLTFDRPTKLLEFGVALLSSSPLSPGFTVKLFDRNGVSLGTFPVNTTVPVSFSEARFVKKGLLVGVKKAVITFDGADAPRFALDNLTYKVAA
jgi:hypothetical protein